MPEQNTLFEIGERSHKLLLDEPPLQVLPSLAVIIGLNEAMALQQLHWLLRQRNRRGERMAWKKEGRFWIVNSYPEWRLSFPFWSVDTIKRTFRALEKKHDLIFTRRFGKQHQDQRKWYTINYAELAKIEAQHNSDEGNLPQSDEGNLPQSDEGNLPQSDEGNLPQSDEGNLPQCSIKEKRTKKRTHTQDKATPVCVPSESEFSFAKRQEYAKQHGLGNGWLHKSSSGEYDRLIAADIEARSLDAAEAKHADPIDDKPTYDYAQKFLGSMAGMCSTEQLHHYIENFGLDSEATALLRAEFLAGKEQ